MKTTNIGIINYGLGNIFSLMNACNHLGFKSFIIQKPTDFTKASHLILPGVGAYSAASLALDEAKMKIPLSEAINNDIPTLGICLGMQLMFKASLEGGLHSGLGFISENIEKLDPIERSKVPHVQWNSVQYFGDDEKKNRALIHANYFYFTHSYASINFTHENLNDYGLTHYGGQTFMSYARKGNITMTQFHPEKSGIVGLKFLENFIGN